MISYKMRAEWAISFTCPRCKYVTCTPITVWSGKRISVYCDKCQTFIKFANRTERRFLI